MSWHKFKIGQRVTYRPSPEEIVTPAIMHIVTALLPAQAGECRYRIQRSADATERSADAKEIVVGESELREIRAR